MTQRGIINLSSIPNKQNFLSRNKQGAEFFPVAYGVQVPYVGRDDSVAIATELQNALEFPSSLIPLGTTVKKNKPKTRLLGDILDPFPHETADNLSNKLTQTTLYLPDISCKRERKQKKQQLKEISKNLGFTDDVFASHCSHVLDYNEDKSNKTIYQKSTGKKGKVVGVMGHDGTHRSPLRHLPLEIPSSNNKSEAFHKIDIQMKQEMEDILCCVAKAARPFRHSIVRTDDPEMAHAQVKSAEWDEYVLSLLSQSTATWITSEFSSGTEHARLAAFLDDRYEVKEKSPKVQVECEKPSKYEHTRKRNSKAGAELEKVLTEAIFDVQYSPSFTLPVGDKKYITDNLFEQEMLSGAFPVKGKRMPRKSIVFNRNSKITFEKKLQANYPEDPKKWCDGGRRTSKAPKITGNVKVVKGLQRWNQLPSLLQDEEYVPSFTTIDDKPSESMAEAELQLAHKTKQNDNVLQISEEWRSKWLLEKRWQNDSTDELIKGMNDIHDHVRLAAVAACSKAAEVRQRKKVEHSFGPSAESKLINAENMKRELEPELLECITKLLDDNCKQVCITAAVTLCTLGITESKAVDVLVETVQNGSAIERWAAAQSLASSAHCTDNVITELVAQTSSGGDLLRQEQAAVLLLKLSNQSSLVHAVVAEQLNSNSCQDRLIACRILPRLKGTLNKDVAQKLSHMMWNDWQKDVRTAAAQALGRTGNGKLVHDVLLKRLLDENERIKVDALRKLSNLGVMTAHLLPAFLSCFTNEFVAVRMEAAMAAGVINTPDEDILTGLVKLANDDQSWKVKAHAIKALGVIGTVTDDVIDMLAWNMRYSKLAAVRAEACNAVGQLDLKDSRCLSVLQDRLIVENEEIVRSEARRALKLLNVEITGDVEMVNTIRTEVKRLCNKQNVVSSILRQDYEDDYGKDYKRIIAIDDDTMPYRCTQTPQTARSLKSNASLGWDPILAGFRARSVLSEPSTPIMLRMERSRLPMDLNSATSEGSLESRDDLESEYPDSESSDRIVDEPGMVANDNDHLINETSDISVDAIDV